MRACMQEHRGSSPGTLATYCQSFLHALAFLTADAGVPAAVRSWLSKYQKTAFEQRDVSWQRLKARGRYIYIYIHACIFHACMYTLHAGKWLVWSEILEVLKLQKEMFESAESAFSKAWEAQKYAILLLYCSIPPARGREYRELKLCVTDSDLQLWDPPLRDSNWLLLAADHGRGLLYVGAHKTSKYTGVQRIELSRDGSTHLLLEHLVAFSCRE